MNATYGDLTLSATFTAMSVAQAAMKIETTSSFSCVGEDGAADVVSERKHRGGEFDQQCIGGEQDVTWAVANQTCAAIDNIFALSTSFTRVRAPSAALPAATATLRWWGPATLKKSSAKFTQSPQTLVKWTRLSQKFVGANLRGNGKSIAAVTLNGMQATIGASSDGKI
eukprot:gene23793-28412_t